MKKNIFYLLLIFTLGSLSAQNFTGKLNPFPASRNDVLQNDTIKILAVMVSFEEDRDAATFGTGKFESIYTQDYGNSILDPIPHDQQYFEDHLEFVRNYYLKVSNGNVVIEYTVLPDTFSVSQTMRNYSPPTGSDDFTPMANFASEVWTIADGMFSGTNFSDYNLFIIFHAGVGRDITLPGSLGNERDLPSVYLSENAFKEIFGSEFIGFPVQNGEFHITNSMIMPETESRELQTFQGTFLFEITINGLLVASVASHLGLPDLFNTETGLSAIGRFGLMDGQAIFAYNGTFPPEPSAWEKIFLSEKLGWNLPVVTLTPGEYDISLVANLAASVIDTVILKVPLNSSEYFLIENRGRDVNNDGSTVSYKIGDVVRTKTFMNDTTGYRSFDTDSLAGVIIDVDEFDWALPGSGILIWHIDENIINEKIADNKINNDKARRGVDLEEADGIQDIGEIFFNIFGDQLIGEGEQADIWFSSNNADLYRNRFSKNTRPNSLTNTGANSLITISDFSDIGNRMTFKIVYGDSVIKPQFSENLYFTDAVTELTFSQDAEQNYFNLLTGTDLRVYFNQTELRTINNFSNVKPSSIFINNTVYSFGVNGNSFNSFMINDTEVFFGQRVIQSELTTAPVVVRTLTEDTRILAGTNEGSIITFSPGSLPDNHPDSLSAVVVKPGYIITDLAADFANFGFIAETQSLNENPVFGNSFSFLYEFTDEKPVDLALTKDASGNYIFIVLTDLNNFYIFSENEVINNFNIRSFNGINSFGIADLRKDGNNYIIFNNDDKLEARNFSGSSADNYPVTDPLGMNFSLTPLAMDFEGDDRTELISFTEDGRIFAFDGPSGRLINGFPLSSGTTLSSVPILFSERGVPSIAVVDENNLFSAWNIGSVEGNYYWSEKNGNNMNTSFSPSAETEFAINEFFPGNRAYNYPNPVYDNETYIRYYVSEDSKINIKIFDLAGGFVAEMNDDAPGGLDSETLWNVSDIQSGVYLARIEAVSNSGRSESQVVKIAVVK